MPSNVQQTELWTQVITGCELNLDSGGSVRLLDAHTSRSRRRQLDILGGAWLLDDLPDRKELDQRDEILRHRLTATNCLNRLFRYLSRLRGHAKTCVMTAVGGLAEFDRFSII